MSEKTPDDRGPRPADIGDTVSLSSPTGPHHQGVDEAAGGAGSSPHETEPTGEQKPCDRGPDHGDESSPCQAPPDWFTG